MLARGEVGNDLCFHGRAEIAIFALHPAAPTQGSVVFMPALARPGNKKAASRNGRLFCRNKIDYLILVSL
jgi:hypothetical protein